MALDDNGGGAAGGAQGNGGAATAAGAQATDLLGTPAGASGENAAGSTGAAGQAGGQGAGQGAGQGEGQGEAALEAFYGQFSAEGAEGTPANRDWMRAKGFKDLDGLVKAHRAAEKAIHDSGRIKVPGEGASPEEIAAFNKAIGVPEKPEGYKLPEVKDADGNPVTLDSDRIAAITKIAHANGIAARALEPTLQAIAEAEALELATREGELVAKARAHADAWGTAKENNLAAINRAFEALGVTREESLQLRAAWGPERAMDVFAKLGNGIGEDTMIAGGGKQKFGLSGAEAQKALNDKRSDPAWTARVMQPGTPEQAEYNRLLEAVGAAADRQLQENG